MAWAALDMVSAVLKGDWKDRLPNEETACNCFNTICKPAEHYRNFRFVDEPGFYSADTVGVNISSRSMFTIQHGQSAFSLYKWVS